MHADQIKSFFKGEVLDEPATLARYSRDASVFEVRPEVVVCPKNVADLKVLVKWAAAKRQAGEKVSLTARSGGTDMSGGAINDSIIVDFSKYLNKLVLIKAAPAAQGGTPTVPPGTF